MCSRISENQTNKGIILKSHDVCKYKKWLFKTGISAHVKTVILQPSKMWDFISNIEKLFQYFGGILIHEIKCLYYIYVYTNANILNARKRHM